MKLSYIVFGNCIVDGLKIASGGRSEICDASERTIDSYKKSINSRLDVGGFDWGDYISNGPEYSPSEPENWIRRCAKFWSLMNELRETLREAETKGCHTRELGWMREIVADREIKFTAWKKKLDKRYGGTDGQQINELIAKEKKNQQSFHDGNEFVTYKTYLEPVGFSYGYHRERKAELQQYPSTILSDEEDK